jgi:hypothetical protein
MGKSIHAKIFARSRNRIRVWSANHGRSPRAANPRDNLKPFFHSGCAGSSVTNAFCPGENAINNQA